MIADTSRRAYESLDLIESETEFMRLVRLHYPLPARFTRKEFSRKTGWEVNRVSGRANGCLAKGYIQEYEHTRDGGHLLSIAQPKAAGQAHAEASDEGRKASGAEPASAVSSARFVDGVYLAPGEEIVSQKVVHTHGRNAKGEPIEFSYTSVIIREVARGPI